VYNLVQTKTKSPPACNQNKTPYKPEQ